MGGQNCHLDVNFEDGVTWIARIRLDNPAGPPLETREKIFASEVETLLFLAQTAVPVPAVHHVSYDGREIGRAFILMEKMPGETLDWDAASAQQKTKVMEQLADIFLELEKSPLLSTGSLSRGGEVGAFAQSRMFSAPSESLGPFPALGDALKAIVQHELAMIETGEVSKLAVDHYLTHLWRLDLIPRLVAGDHAFYLKHFDDKGDHILVDKDYNITAILDWEFASAEIKAMAFSSPCMMWPVGEFYDGSNELSAEEMEFARMFTQRGREDLAQCVRQGRRIQRFLFFLGGSPQDREELGCLFQGLRAAFDEDIEPYEEWRRAAIARLGDDPLLQRLMQHDK